jgi:hypothetical protein
MDNMPEHLTAHAIRRLRPCTYCKGMGDGNLMIRHGADERIHTHCFVVGMGYPAALKLSAEEMGKFRLCDLTASQMRKLSASRQKKIVEGT